MNKGRNRIMASESDGPDDVAARLEAALERIAAVAARRPSASPADSTAAPPPAHTEPPAPPEIAARLDGLIDRLRDALAVRPG